MATKYKIFKMQTTGVILANTSVNGELAGMRIEAEKCKELIGESYADIKARLCPKRYPDGTTAKPKDKD